MKNIDKKIKVFTLIILGLLAVNAGHSQNTNLYFNVDWQLNLPVGDDFANRFSGWGAHGEVGYFLTHEFSLGGFVSYHTNHKYKGRESFMISPTATLTTDQQHSIFQVPFGAALRYTITRDYLVEPYFGAKLGANYSETSSRFNIYKVNDKSWGFYMAPELGMTIFFTPEKKFGLHLATYFNYSTNKSQVLHYDLDGLSNWGVRVGAAF